MSLRESLAARTRRRTFFDLPLDDAPEAQAEADAAARAVRVAELDGDEAKVATARDRLEAANAELTRHLLRLTFEGMPLPEWEELRDAHPPTDEQLAKHQEAVAEARAEHAKSGSSEPVEEPAPPQWNPDTFIPALFARCVVVDQGDEPLTETEWAHELRPDGLWHEQEKLAAFQACLSATLVPRSVVIPKD